MGPRKALPALQRGPYCIATGLPLHHNNGPVADQGGPYGRKTRPFPVIFRRSKINKIHVPEKPGGPYGAPAPSIRVKKRAGNHRDRCQNGPKMSKNERFSEQDFVRKSIISMLQQLVYILNTETRRHRVMLSSVSPCLCVQKTYYKVIMNTYKVSSADVNIEWSASMNAAFAAFS